MDFVKENKIMSLELIKEIRQITGAGISDVKKALDEAAGDREKTIEILRKKGQKIAAKKSDREIKEGVIALAQSADKLALVSLGCETDFVARNEDFQQAVSQLAEKLLALGKDEFSAWANQYIQDELIVKIGENLNLLDFEIFEQGIFDFYLHSNRKIAAVVVLSQGEKEIAKEVAMHIAAMAPKYLSADEIPAEEIAKEKEVYQEQLLGEGKPAEMIDKIMPGKIKKYQEEVCLLEQPYIKDDKKSVEQFLADNQAKIERFAYYSL